MIQGARKIPILRYGLIILLFCALFLSALYLYLHYKKAKQLRSNIENLISARENSALIDSCILNLYSADNYSRLYTITGDKTYLKKFLVDINKITQVIDKIKFDKSDVADADPDRFRKLMKQKSDITDSYITLRRLTDSLIKSSLQINFSFNKFTQQPSKPTVKVEHVVTLDTVKQDTKPRKKFLGRLFSAFKSKKQEDKQPKPVVVKDTVTTTTITANPAGKNGNKLAYKIYYNKLNNVNNKLMANERQMLTINNNLIEEIIASLRLYKTVEQLYITNSKNELKENLADVFFEFRQVSAMNLVFLVSLLILVFYNIWKIYKNEQEIIFYSDKAQQYAESKSRFLAGMSHEIRTPLNSVIGFSEQLAQGKLSPVEQEQVDAIRNSSEMLLELVNEILDFSKYETGKMNFENVPFMLNHALEDVFISMNIHALKKNIILKNDIDIDDSICCEGDKMRLKQVVINLLGNAIKFTVKGQVTLKAYIRNDTADNLLLKVRVTDTGLGIDKADLPHIFEEFSQVATAQKATRHKGTGLGLAICKKIIELQGGSISVNSVPGQGSTFSFELPLTKSEVSEQVMSQSLSDDVMANLVAEKHVLFAEDNRLNVLLGTTILKKWNIKFDVAYNGYEAMQLFEKNKYDLILTDIQMPEMSGLELARHVRSHPDSYRSATPIIALTANVMKEDRDVYFNNGINDAVLKPFLERNLIEKAAIVLQSSDSALKFME